jgi:large subunit ribosomal protein L2|tara:strand:+ start:803 stop:1504 length:702 start_codon:yes stop_codon:yes gene_type:complete
MGKRIITQARGKGSHTYKVKRSAFKHKLKFPRVIGKELVVLKLLNSAGHSAPLMKMKCEKGIFYLPAPKEIYEGQKINLDSKEIGKGQIMKLKDIPVKTKVYCIESRPNDGSVFVKSAGSSATVNRVVGEKVFLVMPSKKEKSFNQDCRAVVGVVAGEGKLEKPVVKAGRKFHMKKAKSKLWPRTSAVKMNAIDHPFGSGRAKNPKSKIAKRNAPPGRRVGLLRPKRTGRKKR